VAPAATNAPSAPAVPAATPADVAAPAAPAFGTSRGSGLARGKRAPRPATTSNNTAAANGDYTPTTIQIVTAGREYQNPFAPEQPAEVPAPAVVAASPDRPPEPASAPAPHAATAPAVASQQSDDNAPAEPPPAEPAPGAGEPEKAEIKILPPVDKPRPAQHWDASTPANPGPDTSVHPSLRGDRPVFRPESHSGETRDPRPLRGERGERRRGGRDRDRGDYGDQRAPRDQREPRPETSADSPPDASAPEPTPKKSGGFFGWLKNLFGGSDDDTAKAGPRARSDDGRREGRRDGRRGGRNRDRDRDREGGGGFRGERRDDRPRGHHRDNPRDAYNHRQRGGRGRNSRYRGGERGGGHRPSGNGSSGDSTAS
jgi:translation initiation factor IF-2